MRVNHECGHCFGRANPHSRDAAQLSDARRLLRLMIQLMFDPQHPANQRLDLFEQEIPPQLLQYRGQRAQQAVEVALAAVGLIAIAETAENSQHRRNALPLRAMDDLPCLGEGTSRNPLCVNVQTDAKHRASPEIEIGRILVPSSM